MKYFGLCSLGLLLSLSTVNAATTAPDQPNPAAPIPVVAPAATVATSATTTTSTPLKNLEGVPLDHHKNYFGSGFAAGPNSGITLFYARRLSGRWLLGVSQTFSGSDNNVRSAESGDLATGQYYKDKVTMTSELSELNATYYFRPDGFKRWGAFLRGGLGYENSHAKAGWGRYDQDPGWIIIGDGKRLRESGDVTADWSTGYARMGAYFQFLWAPRNDHAIAGHILELGVSMLSREHTGSISYTKPNGEVFSQKEDSTEGLAEIAYKFIF